MQLRVGSKTARETPFAMRQGSLPDGNETAEFERLVRKAMTRSTDGAQLGRYPDSSVALALAALARRR